MSEGRLGEKTELPSEDSFLGQVHSNRVRQSGQAPFVRDQQQDLPRRGKKVAIQVVGLGTTWHQRELAQSTLRTWYLGAVL